jgi:hypothetical protein
MLVWQSFLLNKTCNELCEEIIKFSAGNLHCTKDNSQPPIDQAAYSIQATDPVGNQQFSTHGKILQIRQQRVY